MYNNNNIPQNNGNMQSYRPNNRPNHGNNNDRFLGGGFIGPFILGGLTGGLMVPRDFIREFVEILDTIEQNQTELNNNEKISELFASKENTSTQEDDLYDDW